MLVLWLWLVRKPLLTHSCDVSCLYICILPPAPLSPTNSTPMVALDTALAHLLAAHPQDMTFLRIIVASRVVDNDGLLFGDVQNKVHRFMNSDLPLTMSISEGVWDQHSPLVLQAWTLG